ncbi:MAG TPA: hypothetical protein PK867_16235 [Pirellulales bacterium]|nr:hypothetical protein [Pirellulales bacterium]
MAPTSNPYEPIDAVLRTAGRELPRLPDWWPRFLELSQNSSDEERLAVYQAVRDDGCLHEDVGSFLVCFMIDERIMRASGGDGPPIDERATQLDAAYEQGKIARDKPPPDADSIEGRLAEAMQALFRSDLAGPAEEVHAYDAQALEAWRLRLLKELEEHGETQLATTLRRSPCKFASAMRSGRDWLFSPPPDAARMSAAVQSLFDLMSGCVHSDVTMGPLRCRWRLDLGFGILDVSIYPTPIEKVGGRRDGKLVDADLSRIDLLAMQEIFDEVHEFYWSVESDERQYQYVSIEGAYGGFEMVSLGLYAGAPEGEKPVLREDVEGKWDPDDDAEEDE